MTLSPPRRLLAWVFALLCALCASHAIGAAPQDETPSEVVQLREADFLQDGAPATAQRVPLPDTWAQRGLAPRGIGSYRIVFDLARAPDRMWALRADRISSVHAVHLNGRLVHASEDGRGIGLPTAQLIDLPPQALHAGTNELRIELGYYNYAGLSALELGPHAELRDAFARHVALNRTLPQGLNLVGAAFGLFMLAIWMRRRGEAAMGWFGALCLLVSVRNYGYFALDGETLSQARTDWLLYVAQLGSAVLFGAFAMALSGRRLRWFERALLLISLVMPVLAALATGASMQWLRTLTYPLLIGLSLVSLWLVFEHARLTRQHAALVLLTGFSMLLVAAVHDYLYQHGQLAGGYWMPYATPFALISFSLALVNRLVQALNGVETLNASLERRVAERTHELELANTAKTRFLAAASHDMRQPVATMGLLIGLLREHPGAAPLRAMLDRLHEAAASMEALLKGLMDLSRLESGTVAPRLQAVSLAPLFEAIGLHHQPAAAEKNLRLRLRVFAPAVLGDPVLLEQIVRNLVDNAIRYTERGGVLVAARPRRGGSVLLQVFDSGRGIAREAQAQVFEEFVQLDNPGRDRSKGLGLGLAIVQRSARLLGRRVTLRSVPGRGSCFTLELPTALPVEPAAAALMPRGSAPLAGVAVWLIEDDDAQREAMSERLRRWGAQVTALAGQADLRRRLEAPSGERTPAPALVLSDQRLGDGSGVDCVALVRAHIGRAVPAVIVTGETAPAAMALLAACGLPVLHKPFRADELLALLHAALRGRCDEEESSGDGDKAHCAAAS